MVLSDFAAQRVAVNSKNFGGTALVPLGVFQNAFDELFLEFGERFFEQDPAIHHHSDQRFQLLFHCARSAKPLGNGIPGFSRVRGR
jgi:hypothetical protein